MAEKTYIQIYTEVMQKYKLKILPRCRIYEEERKRLRKEYKTAIINMFTYFLIFIIICPPLLIAIPMMLGLRYWIQCIYFPREVKAKTLKYFCDCFEDLQWIDTSECIPDCLFVRESNLFKIVFDSVWNFDDFFTGSYNGINFEIFELHSLGNFKGVIVKIEIDKPFMYKTVIHPNTLLHLSPDPFLEYTSFEDMGFEEKFDVFTNNEAEARYLITPTFMERLNNLKMAFKVNKISCSFYCNHLFIALHSKKDLFKFASFNKSMLDDSEFMQMFKEIISVYEMIDHFKLREKTRL